MALTAFPLLLLPFLAYNFLVVLPEINPLEDILLRVELSPDTLFSMTVGETFVAVSLVLLGFDLLKAARRQGPGRLELAMAGAVFALFVAEFLLVERAGSAPFLIMTMMALIAALGAGLALARASGPTFVSDPETEPAAGRSGDAIDAADRAGPV